MIKNLFSKKGIIILAILLIIGFIFLSKGKKETNQEMQQEQKASYGDITTYISTTGTVEPKNRLEIKPPISGRIEEILVEEGDDVKEGQVIALMSSTERAALLDAAKLKGIEEVEYWENVYKQAPLISPIDGKIIVRSVEPGQTVTSSDPVLVVSDHLIVTADLDETDIGKVKVGQKAIVYLDAYEDMKVSAKVDHISYESEEVNNVTIYTVDISLDETPSFFRSGMSATVEIVDKEKENILLIPLDFIIYNDNKTFVNVKNAKTGQIEKVQVKTGIFDDENIEIISGITAKDVLVSSQYQGIERKESKTSPFGINRRNKKK